ncbi:hypothetical protein HDF26_003606 [Pedobacter cryoconitis]|uniref:bacteriocin n=1 Tax=Pedobacter cryoconitis TaxID=188932 RepID=UPI00160FAB71|nr:bacteriocin [Pedobacter cryoconitis]MBB6273146.1 hypothetical protein [Pedobacter cryoconitis]
MKKLNLDQMESINGGTNNGRLYGCAVLGLAAGIASTVFAPLVGGLTTAACYMLNPQRSDALPEIEVEASIAQ